jgi:hypothetical protein
MTASPRSVKSRSPRSDDRADDAVGSARALGLAATNDAQEALGRSSRATLDALSTFTEVSQQVNRELAGFMMSGGKETLKLWADMQGTWLEAMHSALGGFSANGPAVEAWAKILDGNTKAFGRYTEVVRETVEEGTDRIKEAVESMAEQVKDSTGQLAPIADVVEDDKPPATGRTRAS